MRGDRLVLEVFSGCVFAFQGQCELSSQLISGISGWTTRSYIYTRLAIVRRESTLLVRTIGILRTSKRHARPSLPYNTEHVLLGEYI